MTDPFAMPGVPVADAPRPIHVDADPMPTPEPFVDYWSGPPAPLRWFLPDGKQYIEYIPLNHGLRKQFLHKTARDMAIDRESNKAHINTDTSGDDETLIMLSATDWNMYRAGNPVPFSKTGNGSTLSQWLTQANPKIVDDLARAIRDANPWMDADITSEMIKEQIEDLEKRLKAKIEEEGKK